LPWGVDTIFRSDLHHIQTYATQLSCCHGVLTNFQVWFPSHTNGCNPTFLLPMGCWCSLQVWFVAHTNGCNPTFLLPWVWQSFQVWFQPHANVCNPTCLLPWGVKCMVNYYIPSFIWHVQLLINPIINYHFSTE
jgi:hypothetical protein